MGSGVTEVLNRFESVFNDSSTKLFARTSIYSDVFFSSFSGNPFCPLILTCSLRHFLLNCCSFICLKIREYASRLTAQLKGFLR